MNIIFLIVLNYDFISIEFYNIFIKKEKKRYKKKERKSEEDDSDENDSDMDYSELLTDENIEKFLQDCKIKFKDNVRSFYQMLINTGENVEDLFPDDIEFLTQKKPQEEIEKFLEEKIKDKYFKSLAKYIIASKLQKKKIKNYLTKNYDEEINSDCDDSDIIFEEEIEIDEDDVKEILLPTYMESFKNFIYNLYGYVFDTVLSYLSLVLMILFTSHLEKNVFVIICYYVLNILLLIKVIFFFIFFTFRALMFLMKIIVYLNFFLNLW